MGMVFMIIWEMFRGMISLSLVLLLLLVNFVSGFRLDLMYISLRKYQVKPYSSPWFSASCAAAIVHRNHFFHLYQKDQSSDSKLKFRQASNCCKRILEAAKFAYANKTKVCHFLVTFGELPIVFSTKVNLLYLFFSMVWRYCLLYLLKQNCLLKTFQEL